MVPATRIDSLKAPTGFKINAENTRAVFAKRCFMSFFFGMRIAGNGRLERIFVLAITCRNGNQGDHIAGHPRAKRDDGPSGSSSCRIDFAGGRRPAAHQNA